MVVLGVVVVCGTTSVGMIGGVWGRGVRGVAISREAVPAVAAEEVGEVEEALQA